MGQTDGRTPDRYMTLTVRCGQRNKWMWQVRPTLSQISLRPIGLTEQLGWMRLNFETRSELLGRNLRTEEQRRDRSRLKYGTRTLRVDTRRGCSAGTWPLNACFQRNTSHDATKALSAHVGADQRLNFVVCHQLRLLLSTQLISR